MVGIYRYQNGLVFTGEIANSIEEAKAYLGKKYGRIEKVFSKWDNNGKPIYKSRFVPYYNKEAFEFLEVKIV